MAHHPPDDPPLSIVDARGRLLRRWTTRAGGRARLPPEAGSVAFTLLAAALEPDDPTRRFIAGWYLRAARRSLEDRGDTRARRRRVFVALVHAARGTLRVELPERRARSLAERLERRVVESVPELDPGRGDAPPTGDGGSRPGRSTSGTE